MMLSLRIFIEVVFRIRFVLVLILILERSFSEFFSTSFLIVLADEYRFDCYDFMTITR